MLETYNGDPVRIRLLQSAQRRVHSFNLHRQRWHRERPDLIRKWISINKLSISESYTLEFNMEGKGTSICSIIMDHWTIFG